MEVIAKIISAIFLGILIGLIVSLPIMWLWNWLMPEIFGLPTISFLQSIGLILLSHIFFNNSTTVNKK